MSQAVALAPAGAGVRDGARVRWRGAVRWILLGVALLMIAQYLAEAPGLTASSTWGSALRLTVPIAVAAMGGLFSERAGIINVGIEGMMVGGTWMAGLFGWIWGPAAALLGGMVGGLIFGVLMAVLCVEMGINQLVVGVSINVIAVAVARFLSDVVFDGVDGGTIARSPRIDGSLPNVSVPFLSGGWGTPNIMGDWEASGIPLISQIGGIVGGLTRDVSVAALIGLAMVPLTSYLLWKTRFGLRWRAAGERPAALQSLGGDVHAVRWAAVLTGSAMAGFAGGYLVLMSQMYVENQTAGRGFVALATLIFGNWMPGGVFAGSALFGFSDAVGLGRPETLRALVFVLGGVFLALAVQRLARRAARTAIAPAVLGALLIVVFVAVPLPAALASATPYLVTLAVLVVAGSRMRPPAALGAMISRRNS